MDRQHVTEFEKVPVDDLKIGDVVFAPDWTEYELVRVRVGRRSTRITREDGAVDYFENGRTITIKRRPA